MRGSVNLMGELDEVRYLGRDEDFWDGVLARLSMIRHTIWFFTRTRYAWTWTWTLFIFIIIIIIIPILFVLALP